MSSVKLRHFSWNRDDGDRTDGDDLNVDDLRMPRQRPRHLHAHINKSETFPLTVVTSKTRRWSCRRVSPPSSPPPC